MGYVAEPTPEMGEYHVEVRSESFYLSVGPDDLRMYAFGVGPSFDTRTVELLIEDIPKIRAALDQVERHLAGGPDAPIAVDAARDRYRDARTQLAVALKARIAARVREVYPTATAISIWTIPEAAEGPFVAWDRVTAEGDTLADYDTLLSSQLSLHTAVQDYLIELVETDWRAINPFGVLIFDPRTTDEQ